MKLFKVVTKDRKSALMERPHYKRKYKKGTVVRMAGRSFGIFCFEKRLHATDFAANFCLKDRGAQVIEVELVGKILPQPEFIFAIVTSHGVLDISLNCWRKGMKLLRDASLSAMGEVAGIPTQSIYPKTVLCEAVRVIT